MLLLWDPNSFFKMFFIIVTVFLNFCAQMFSKNLSVLSFIGIFLICAIVKSSLNGMCKSINSTLFQQDFWKKVFLYILGRLLWEYPSFLHPELINVD